MLLLPSFLHRMILWYAYMEGGKCKQVYLRDSVHRCLQAGLGPGGLARQMAGTGPLLAVQYGV